MSATVMIGNAISIVKGELENLTLRALGSQYSSCCWSQLFREVCVLKRDWKPHRPSLLPVVLMDPCGIEPHLL